LSLKTRSKGNLSPLMNRPTKGNLSPMMNRPARLYSVTICVCLSFRQTQGAKAPTTNARR